MYGKDYRIQALDNLVTSQVTVMEKANENKQRLFVQSLL